MSIEANIARSNEPFVFSQGEGKAIWFLGTLVTLKAVGENTQDAFALLEHVIPPGAEPPPHIHHKQDEAFYLLEGTMTIRCGDHTWKASAGAFVFLPQGIVHAFTVEGTTPVKMLSINSPSGPLGFEYFVEEMGEPAKELTLPPAGPPNMEKLLALTAKYEIELQVALR